MVPTFAVENYVKQGNDIRDELVAAGQEEWTQDLSPVEVMGEVMGSSADYGLLVASLIEHFDEDARASELYHAIALAFIEYLDEIA